MDNIFYKDVAKKLVNEKIQTCEWKGTVQGDFNVDSCPKSFIIPFRNDSIFACQHMHGFILNLYVIILCIKGEKQAIQNMPKDFSSMVIRMCLLFPQIQRTVWMMR